ncbi:MAG: replication initiator protein A, partial [Culicoidibacterales bacterium]
MNTQRISKQKYELEQFYKMPKWLFSDKFKKLSNDARVAYVLLKDRHSLSLK